MLFHCEGPLDGSRIGVIGFDPDAHFASMVGIDLAGDIFLMGQTQVDKKVKGENAVAQVCSQLSQLSHKPGIPDQLYLLVESQTVNMGRKNVESLLMISKVSGAAACILAPHATPRPYFVPPVMWKGSVKKELKTEQLVRALGLPAVRKGRGFRVEWPYEAFSALPTERHGHLIDAWGIARWGLDNLKRLPLLFTQIV